jgi:transcriptional repressor NrdR
MACGHRFTTYEEIENEAITVVKRDERREPFSREKLLESLKIPCRKRPISSRQLEEIADKIEKELGDKYDREVPSMAIGERIMAQLKSADPVAYVRYASVYRRFGDPAEFVQEVKRLEENNDPTAP